MARKLTILFVLLLFYSCAEEDPNLVNAPPQTESIRVRFLNFYSPIDANITPPSFQLVLDGKAETELIPNQMISAAIKPPSDSSIVSFINEEGREVYKSSRKLRFSRGNFYSVIYSKAYYSDSTGTRLVDTSIFITSLLSLIHI